MAGGKRGRVAARDSDGDGGSDSDSDSGNDGQDRRAVEHDEEADESTQWLREHDRSVVPALAPSGFLRRLTSSSQSPLSGRATVGLLAIFTILLCLTGFSPASPPESTPSARPGAATPTADGLGVPGHKGSAQTHPSSVLPVPSTSRPATLRPTPPPNEAIFSVSDPRYGPKVPEFSQERLSLWEKLWQQRVDTQKEIREKWPTGGDGWSNLAHWDGTRTALCEAQAKENLPPKYVFDPAEYPLEPGPPSDALGLPFDPTTAKRHFLQYRAFLAEYYQAPATSTNGGEPTVFKNAWASGVSDELRPQYLPRRWAYLVAARIAEASMPVAAPVASPPTARPTTFEAANITIPDSEPAVMLTSSRAPDAFVVGIMGTSIIAGMDNCWAAAFPPLLERQLRPLLAPLGLRAEVRGAGQNGDGPSSGGQILCSVSRYGDKLDALIVNYHMIPLDLGQLAELYNGWMARNTHVTSMFGFEEIELQRTGMISITGKELFEAQPGWEYWPKGAKHHWGRVTDPACHTVTREGFDATFMQNWHPGPAGFQMWADRQMWLYTQVFVWALEYLEVLAASATPPRSAAAVREMALKEFDQLNVPSAPQPDPEGTPPFSCISGSLPKWLPGLNLTERMVDQNAMRVLAPKECKLSAAPATESIYEVQLFKRNSRVGGSKDAHAPSYRERPECLAHTDFGYVLHTRPGYKADGCVGIRLPLLPEVRRVNATGTLIICDQDKRNTISIFDMRDRYSFLLDGKVLPVDADVDHPAKGSMPPMPCAYVWKNNAVFRDALRRGTEPAVLGIRPLVGDSGLRVVEIAFR